MKKSQLQQIIREEINNTINEIDSASRPTNITNDSQYIYFEYDTPEEAKNNAYYLKGSLRFNIEGNKLNIDIDSVARHLVRHFLNR